jgi:glycosyltransferase involved in cell wall biosynthesis
LLPLWARFFYRWADAVVAVSQGVADELVHYVRIPAEKVRVIYNPIVTPELFRKAEEPLEHPWFREGEPPVILGVGRLTKQKDFPTLIRAFALVRQQRPARLMILGEGEERPQLEALVKELGIAEDVSLPGFVQNPYPYMKKAAVFVLSSRWEGLPTVLIEAAALDVPVISTNCPSGPAEILAMYSDQLVDVGDKDGMARAILKTLQSRRVERVNVEPYTLNHALSYYLKLLEEPVCRR